MKSGLDWFPLDTVNDDKLDLFQAQHKAVGLGVLFQLFREIYGRYGYYLPWGEDMALLLASRIGIDMTTMNSIVETALYREIFSEEKLNEFAVLTSRGIQKRYFDASKRRRTVEADENLLLIPIDSIYDVADIRWVNVNPASQQFKPAEQSAAEFSREKYMQEKKKRQEQADGRRNRGAYGYVRLSDDEMAELESIYPKRDILLAINYVDEYCARNKNKFGWKDWKVAIARAIDNNWGKDENGELR